MGINLGRERLIVLMRGMGGNIWWRVESEEWRVERSMGNVCGRRGTERTGNVSRAGWPARVPCNPAPTVEFVSIAIRKVPGSKDVPAGGACPAPTDGGIFAAIAGQG